MVQLNTGSTEPVSRVDNSPKTIQGAQNLLGQAESGIRSLDPDRNGKIVSLSGIKDIIQDISPKILETAPNAEMEREDENSFLERGFVPYSLMTVNDLFKSLSMVNGILYDSAGNIRQGLINLKGKLEGVFKPIQDFNDALGDASVDLGDMLRSYRGEEHRAEVDEFGDEVKDLSKKRAPFKSKGEFPEGLYSSLVILKDTIDSFLNSTFEPVPEDKVTENTPLSKIYFYYYVWEFFNLKLRLAARAVSTEIKKTSDSAISEQVSAELNRLFSNINGKYKAMVNEVVPDDNSAELEKINSRLAEFQYRTDHGGKLNDGREVFDFTFLQDKVVRGEKLSREEKARYKELRDKLKRGESLQGSEIAERQELMRRRDSLSMGMAENPNTTGGGVTAPGVLPTTGVRTNKDSGIRKLRRIDFKAEVPVYREVNMLKSYVRFELKRFYKARSAQDLIDKQLKLRMKAKAPISDDGYTRDKFKSIMDGTYQFEYYDNGTKKSRTISKEERDAFREYVRSNGIAFPPEPWGWIVVLDKDQNFVINFNNIESKFTGDEAKAFSGIYDARDLYLKREDTDDPDLNERNKRERESAERRIESDRATPVDELAVRLYTNEIFAKTAHDKIVKDCHNVFASEGTSGSKDLVFYHKKRSDQTISTDSFVEKVESKVRDVLRKAEDEVGGVHGVRKNLLDLGYTESPISYSFGDLSLLDPANSGIITEDIHNMVIEFMKRYLFKYHFTIQELIKANVDMSGNIEAAALKAERVAKNNPLGNLLHALSGNLVFRFTAKSEYKVGPTTPESDSNKDESVERDFVFMVKRIAVDRSDYSLKYMLEDGTVVASRPIKNSANVIFLFCGLAQYPYVAKKTGEDGKKPFSAAQAIADKKAHLAAPSARSVRKQKEAEKEKEAAAERPVAYHSYDPELDVSSAKNYLAADWNQFTEAKPPSDTPEEDEAPVDPEADVSVADPAEAGQEAPSTFPMPQPASPEDAAPTEADIAAAQPGVNVPVVDKKFLSLARRYVSDISRASAAAREAVSRSEKSMSPLIGSSAQLINGTKDIFKKAEKGNDSIYASIAGDPSADHSRNLSGNIRMFSQYVLNTCNLADKYVTEVSSYLASLKLDAIIPLSKLINNIDLVGKELGASDYDPNAYKNEKEYVKKAISFANSFRPAYKDASLKIVNLIAAVSRLSKLINKKRAEYSDGYTPEAPDQQGFRKELTADQIIHIALNNPGHLSEIPFSGDQRLPEKKTVSYPADLTKKHTDILDSIDIPDELRKATDIDNINVEDTTSGTNTRVRDGKVVLPKFTPASGQGPQYGMSSIVGIVHNFNNIAQVLNTLSSELHMKASVKPYDNGETYTGAIKKRDSSPDTDIDETQIRIANYFRTMDSGVMRQAGLEPIESDITFPGSGEDESPSDRGKRVRSGLKTIRADKSSKEIKAKGDIKMEEENKKGSEELDEVPSTDAPADEEGADAPADEAGEEGEAVPQDAIDSAIKSAEKVVDVLNALSKSATPEELSDVQAELDNLNGAVDEIVGGAPAAETPAGEEPLPDLGGAPMGDMGGMPADAPKFDLSASESRLRRILEHNIR